MLTDTQCKNAKPREAGYRLADSAGLFLFVTPTGAKVWRHRYFHGGRERVVSLGPYPALGLADARRLRNEQRKALLGGADPAIERRIARHKPSGLFTFERVAREWFAQSRPQWTDTHAKEVLHSLKGWIFPEFGSMPIASITPPIVLAALRKVEARVAKETARRTRQRVSAVFVYAIASSIAETDPAAIIEKAMAPLPSKGRQPALTSLKEARAMLQRCEAEPAHPVTKLALRFPALTVVRPGTLASTPWSELTGLDADQPVWQISSERMKLRLIYKGDETRDHMVPLTQQALDVIEALRALTGRGPIVFPNVRHAHKPMSENAMGYLLNRAGYHGRHVPHGWRATFSTIMNERHKADRRIIDLMLAHSPKDKVEAAYNRAAYLERRRELAGDWSTLLLEGLPPAAALITGPRR